MIKVIKHGYAKYQNQCNNCKCEFEYELEDIQNGFVKCPDCGDECLHNSTRNGLHVRLPCKVDDVCYFVTTVEGEYDILCGWVASIRIDHKGIWLVCHYQGDRTYWHDSENDDLFFTYSDAEKKLKKLKGEEK